MIKKENIIAKVFRNIFSFFAFFLLIHFLSVFGFFLALTYPLWWLLKPKENQCFFCNIKKNYPDFPFFGQGAKIIHSFHPHNFATAIVNSGLIIIISFLCFGFVILESRIFFNLHFPPAQKTALFNLPAEEQYFLGEIFPVKLEINSLQAPINSLRVDLGFDPEVLEVVKISTKNSFANIFIEKEICNHTGYLRLAGGLSSPGFNQEKGLFGTIFFKAKSPGHGKVEFLPTSLILANDGHGTNVLKDLAITSYFILPEKISKEAEEGQQALIEEKILGEETKISESTKGAQLTFYTENTSSSCGFVLGEENDQFYFPNKPFPLNLLLKINSAILVFWGKVTLLF